jgi:hypothetical protein
MAFLTHGDRSVVVGALRRLFGLVAILVVATGLVRPSASSVDGLTEYEVKAAFLFNFTRFVEWPGSAFANDRAPIVIGLFHSDPFGAALRRVVEGQTVRGRAVEVRVVKSYDEVRTCHLVFVSAAEERRIPDLLRSGAVSRVLVVGESSGFAQAGGMMNFVMDGSRVRFEVNLRAAERAGLKLSSRLLSMARLVDRRSGGES